MSPDSHTTSPGSCLRSVLIVLISFEVGILLLLASSNKPVDTSKPTGPVIGVDANHNDQQALKLIEKRLNSQPSDEAQLNGAAEEACAMEEVMQRHNPKGSRGYKDDPLQGRYRSLEAGYQEAVKSYGKGGALTKRMSKYCPQLTD